MAFSSVCHTENQWVGLESWNKGMKGTKEGVHGALVNKD
jgi:hypothetical protein